MGRREIEFRRKSEGSGMGEITRGPWARGTLKKKKKVFRKV